MKREIIIILILIAIVQSIAVLYFYKKWKIKTCITNDHSTLKYLAHGDNVRALQQQLNGILKQQGEITFLDGNTADAVNELLDVDGFFGKQTEKTLFAVTGKRCIEPKQITAIEYV